MSNAPHLTMISEVMPVIRRDFPLADPTILSPTGANPLLDGEWLQLDSSYKLARGSGEQTAVTCFQVFAEKGRYDTQAAKKTPVLFLGYYEAETDICNVASLGVGDKLVVDDVSIGGLNRRALKKHAGGATTKLVFGYVTKLVGTTKVRYITHAGWPTQWTI